MSILARVTAKDFPAAETGLLTCREELVAVEDELRPLVSRNHVRIPRIYSSSEVIISLGKFTQPSSCLLGGSEDLGTPKPCGRSCISVPESRMGGWIMSSPYHE